MAGTSAGASVGASADVESLRARFTRTRTRPLERRTIPDERPDRIGRYTIKRRLGMGGMSVVYEALDERVGRSVALKLMLLGDAAVDRQRLRREAQALARLSHPNVVEVFEIGEHPDPGTEQSRAYVAMALVEGHALDRWLALRRRTPAEIVEVFTQAGAGLAAAHAHGLVHRDFKPGNVLVGHDGRVRVVDFGLVRESDASEPASADVLGLHRAADSSAGTPAIASWNESLTKTGAMVGTPAYMSPEQLTGQPTGPASDQFSFCVALYEALLHQHPFVAHEEWSRLPFNVLDGAIQRPPSEHCVPARLLGVITRGLAVRPQERWPSIDVLLAELRRALERRGPRPLWAVLTVGVVAASLWALAQPSEANVADRCEEAATTMRQAWGPDARQGLRDAWMHTGRPSDADTWSRVDARMQTYAEDWWAMHRAACSGPARSPSSATCLARLAEGVRTRLQVMGQPNDSLSDNAVPMIGELASVQRCGAALDDLPQAPAHATRPDDPSWSAELERLDALMRAGRFGEARPELEALLERAGRESNPRLAAETKLRLGQGFMDAGQVERAAEALEQAYLDAKQAGRDRLAAEAALLLLQLFGERHYREAEATRWARHARAEAERVDDPRLTSRLYNAWGRALRGGEELTEALALHEQALAIQRTLPEVEDSEIALSLFQIGSCMGLLNRGEEGLDYLRQALRLQEGALGPRHPRVASTLVNVGVFMMMAEDYDGALATFEHALDIMLEWAPDNPESSWVLLVNIASIHRTQERPEQAIQSLRRYLEIVERSPDPEAVPPGRLDWVRGEIALDEGEPERALLHFERAAKGDHEQRFDRSRALMGLATALHRVGRLEDAVVAYRRGLAHLQSTPASDRRVFDLEDSIGALRSLAKALAELGDHQAALRELERARDLHVEHFDDGDALHELEVRIGVQQDALEAQRRAPSPASSVASNDEHRPSRAP